MDNRSGDSAGGFKVQVRANTTKFTNMIDNNKAIRSRLLKSIRERAILGFSSQALAIFVAAVAAASRSLQKGSFNRQ